MSDLPDVADYTHTEFAPGEPVPEAAPVSPDSEKLVAELPATFDFVPKDKRSGAAKPEAKPAAKPQPELPATFDFVPPEKRTKAKEEDFVNPEPVGIPLNLAAGAIEGVTPGVAHAAASPIDWPVNAAREVGRTVVGLPQDIEGLGKTIGSLFGWSTPADVEDVYKRQHAAQKSVEDVIPASPVGSWLTSKANQWSGGWLPTPENPIQSIPARTDEERMARRAAQVASQTAASSYAGKAIGNMSIPGASPELTAGILAAPRFMGSTPPIPTGVMAGGGDVAGQFAGQQARQAGFPPEMERQAQIGVGLASALPIGLGMTGARAGLGAGYRAVGSPGSVPALEIAASGKLGSGLQQQARDKLAARAVNESGVEALAKEGDWNSVPDDVHVGHTLGGQLADEKAAGAAQQQALQAQADEALGRIGGVAENLQTRLGPQQTAMESELSLMNVLPSAAGKKLRAIKNILKKEGPLAGILDKDEKGKPVVEDSAIPGKVFNPNITTEDYTSMLHQAGTDFREAYQATALANFMNAAGIRDASGKKIIGIDLTKAGNWQEKFKSTLDNYDERTNSLWGPKDAAKYSIRDKVDLAIQRQKGINDLNAERDGLLASVGEGGKDKDIATFVWKPGSAGGATVKSYLDRAGAIPDAVNNLVDIASASLRNFATKGGEFKPALAQKWLSSHKDALDQLPADVKARFENAQTAQQLVDEHTATRAQALNSFEKGAAKGMLAGKDPIVAIRDIFSNTAVSPEIAMRELSDRLSPDPAAHNGLKRDFMKFAFEDAQNKTAASIAPQGKLGGVLSFLRGEPQLNENFNKTMENLDAFLKKNQASVRALYGDPATDHMLSMMRNKPGYAKPNSIGWLIGGLIGGGAVLTDIGSYTALSAVQHLAGAHPVAAGTMAVGSLGVAAVNKLRAAGVRNVNDFLAEAMQNPELMRDLSKSGSDTAAWKRIMKQLAVIGTDEAMGKYGIGKSSAPALPPT